jgi:hypothetical protein
MPRLSIQVRTGISGHIRRRVIALVLSVAVLLGGASLGAPASASDPVFIGWSKLLPAWAYEYNPTSKNDCKAGRISCVYAAIKKMERRFEPLAKSCDHDAIFSLAYLRTTQEYARSAQEPNFYNDPAFVNHEDVVFAEFYFNAYDSWADGRLSEVPESWRVAFRAADNRQVSGSGNLYLGMNAHVNRDLPFVLAGIGLVAPDGSSRKADHDKVNEMLNRVTEPLLAELARRFDPTMDDTATPYGVSYTAFFQTLAAWRETAWRNAERLVAAPDKQARQAVADEIEAYAAETARALVANYSYKPPLTTSAQRDAFCASQAQ